ISDYNNPVLKFKTWHSKQQLAQLSDVDLFIYLSSDAGKTWVEVFKLDDKTNSQKVWNQQYIRIRDQVSLTNQFKFAIGINPNSYFQVSNGFPTCFSEFQIDDISIIDPSSVSTVESELGNQYSIVVEDDNIIISIADGETTYSDISLYDINGRVLATKSNTNHSRTIAISRSNLLTGVYFLEINHGNQVITKKVLID
ncbi:MAG: T9SS type A sorting domain-containing protein, partial [Candidatus Kapaibacterium sp.]